MCKGTLAPECLGNLSNIIMGFNKALRAILHLCSFFHSLWFHWSRSGALSVVTPHTSTHQGSILNSSLLLGLSKSVLNFQLLHFTSTSQNTCRRGIGFAKRCKCGLRGVILSDHTPTTLTMIQQLLTHIELELSANHMHL